MKRLWYDKPAKEWEEALPIGNGRMGAMVFGGPAGEHLQLNEESMWYGGYTDRLNSDAKEYLPRIRSLLREGRIGGAQDLMCKAMSGCPNSVKPYQTLGDLYIDFDNREAVTGYKRSLNLDEAVVRVSCTMGNKKVCREVFASHPADCIVMKIKAEGSKTNLTAHLDRYRYCDGAGRIGKSAITLWGSQGRGGADFRMVLSAKTEGGTVDCIGENLIVRDADTVYLYWSADTTLQHGKEEKEAFVKSYMENAENSLFPEVWEEWTGFEQQEFLHHQALQAFLEEKLTECLNRAMAEDYEKLKAEHVADYRELYGRVQLQLTTEEDDVPTDVRLKEVGEEGDLLLTELLFDYGRYLMIACSRAEGLPATLQGLWNKEFLPPWDSKYTININAEMNYWPVEYCNLPECHMPLFALLKKMQVRGRRVAREMYGCRGFTAHHNTDMHGDCAPQDIWIPATYWPMGAAWLCTHIRKHYEYTQDKEFLAEYLPLMAEAALFFTDYLTPEGEYMTTNPSVSPENEYRHPGGQTGACCIGATMDNQILRDLFTDCLMCWEELAGEKGQDGTLYEERLMHAFAKLPDMPEPEMLLQRLKELLEKLPPTRIDSHGRIMEWMEEYEELEPGHRHISHLYGLYPSDQITVDETPELAAAASRALESRLANGGGHTGWSRAWIINHYAKLWQGDKAYEHITHMLRDSTYPNLFDKHPPFQIDGNFGVCAGIAQMLVQSHGNRVILLPALPAKWQSGSVKGLKVVSGATVSVAWEKGCLTWLEIESSIPMEYEVVYGTEKRKAVLSSGERYCFSNL